MHGDRIRRQPPAELPDDALWQQSRMVEVVADEVAYFLDLAGFADGTLDVDDRERVAERVAGDSAAADDVAAARALAAAEHLPSAPDHVVARASALVGSEPPRRGNVVPLRWRLRAMPALRLAASWGSLAAAMAVVGWLGFNLGMNASLSVATVGQPSEEGFLQEFVDPSSGFIRELNEGVQS
jgi:anti-sigma factor RsiW